MPLTNSLDFRADQKLLKFCTRDDRRRLEWFGGESAGDACVIAIRMGLPTLDVVPDVAQGSSDDDGLDNGGRGWDRRHDGCGMVARGL